MAKPTCPNGGCRSTSIKGKKTTFDRREGMLIYCGACGHVITWAALPR